MAILHNPYLLNYAKMPFHLELNVFLRSAFIVLIRGAHFLTIRERQ